MKRLQFKSLHLVLSIPLFCFVGCIEHGGGGTPPSDKPDYYYTGGELGTTEITTSKCFEQPTPSVENNGLADSFLHGEAMFEGVFVTEAADKITPMRGKGPLSIRSSCLHCHPGYGHGKRLGNLGNDVVGFNTHTRETGNGYLLVVYGPGANGAFGADEVITEGITGSDWKDATSEDDFFVAELTGMPQTQALAPFKAPIDENLIEIKWHKYVDEHGNKYADGTSYELIYPEVIIPDGAFAYKNENLTNGAYKVKVEATIGIYGTGLVDAISDEDIDAEYEKQKGQVWGGRRGSEITNLDGKKRKARYTYALTRSALQNGAGSNAFWNITNVTRESANNPLYRTNYMTAFYAEQASNDPEVLAALSDTYYKFLVGANEEETKNKVYNYLRWNSDHGDEKYMAMGDVDPATQDAYVDEVSSEDYVDLMVWHRGLAVPAARNIDSEEFKRGMELFTEMGCASCHRPSWTTGQDTYVGDADLMDKLPRYPGQKIWPYSDFLQHNLGMKNNIRTGWCRTTPLWGRHLNLVANGESSHLHDMRARTYEEAIMWHKGQGKYSSDQFRKLSKQDRDAVVKFLQSI